MHRQRSLLKERQNQNGFKNNRLSTPNKMFLSFLSVCLFFLIFASDACDANKSLQLTDRQIKGGV